MRTEIKRATLGAAEQNAQKKSESMHAETGQSPDILTNDSFTDNRRPGLSV